MSEIFVGCTLSRLPAARVAERLGFFELAPQAPLPKPGTFARFRKSCPQAAPFALVLPRSTWTTPQGPFRPGPELDKRLQWALSCADAGGAFAIVVASGADASVGQRDRDLVAAFIARLRESGRMVVFAPRGLWEPETAQPFCDDVGAVYGFDPLEHDAPPHGPIYARVRPMGARARLSEGLLTVIAERVRAADRAPSYVAFEDDRAPLYAKKMRALLGELAEQDDLAEEEAFAADEELEEDAED